MPHDWLKKTPVTFSGLNINTRKSQNVSDFDKLQVGKISTSKCLRVRIIHVSQTLFWKEFACDPTSLMVEKILPAKLCKWTEKLTWSPVFHAIRSKTRITCNSFACIFHALHQLL